MSATTTALPSQSELSSGMGTHVLQASEILIGVLWIFGALRYVRQDGRFATSLMAATLLLALPRMILLIFRVVRPVGPSAPHLWMLLLGLFLPEHLTSAGGVVAPHVVPLALAAVCAIFEIALPFETVSGWLAKENRAAACLGVCVLAYLSGCTALAILKLHAFGYVGQDIGYFMQCLYTGLHGELFTSNQYHDLLYSSPVASDFAGHNQPVLFLLLPLYWLHPHATTLFIVRNLCLAASAFPAYQLARYRLAAVPSLTVVLAFLLGPAILFQNFYDYAPLSLSGLPLLFALLFYTRRQFLPYIASLLLCLFIREDLVIVIIGMGLMALFGHRERKWVVVPILTGVAWGVLTWGFIFPHFRYGATPAVESCFSYLGSTPAESLRTIVFHPSAFVTHKAIVYVKQVFTQFGIVLPFFSPVSLIAVPYLMINILGDPGCNSAIVFRHYSLIPAILLLPGVIVAIRGVASRSKFGWKPEIVAFAVLLASVGTTILSLGQPELSWWHRAPWQSEARQIARQLPAHAAVAVPRYMLPLTANRDSVYQTLRLLDYYHPAAEYVVIDRDSQRMGLTASWQDHYDLLISQLNDPSRFDILYSSDNFVIYHVVGRPLTTLRLSPGGSTND